MYSKQINTLNITFRIKIISYSFYWIYTLQRPFQIARKGEGMLKASRSYEDNCFSARTYPIIVDIHVLVFSSRIFYGPIPIM